MRTILCREERKPKSVSLLALLAPLFWALPSSAQEVGAKLGSRDPRTCASRSDALTAETARQYFICDQEFTVGTNASGESIYLVADVTVQLGRPRAFYILTDTFGFAQTNAIDPSEKVVPIRGSFNESVCGSLGGSTPRRAATATSPPTRTSWVFASSTALATGTAP